MTDNEFLLEDRLQKIRQIINKYGEENFYISFSGGKDSTVLSALVEMTIPDNKIPRVYANTGIEYCLILEFVEREIEKEHLWDLVILKPSIPIKPMLEKEGYPFKSKEHARYVQKYQKDGLNYKSVRAYLKLEPTLSGKEIFRACPKKLKYQFTDKNTLKISDACCFRMKEEPLNKWSKENNRPYGITGIMRSEKGRRSKSNCLTFNSNGSLHLFQPLVPVTKEWENWFIDAYNIDISDIYKEPYNLERTGCKGCPFALHLQEELDVLEKFFPNERKQCEVIWKPVYDEYRRIGYRLKPLDEHHQLSKE